MSKQGWDWVTSEMFENGVRGLAHTMGTDAILDVGDVYVLVAEELNNDVLEHLAAVHDRCGNCGGEIDNQGLCPEDKEEP